jgi:short-subunit dehydrogenase
LAVLNALVIPGDVTSQDIREEAVERTYRRYGRIDLLINSAGIGLYAPPTDVTIQMFSRVMQVNVFAPLALAQLVIPIMKDQSGGTIVTIGSVAGAVALPWAAAYSASKFAVHAVHDSLRRQLRGDCIHLIKVCPGIVNTQFRQNVLAGAVPAAVKSIQRVVSPDLVAERILSAIRHRRRTVYVPRIGLAFTTLGVIAPYLMDWYLSRFFTPAEPEDPDLESGIRESDEFALNRSPGFRVDE